MTIIFLISILLFGTFYTWSKTLLLTLLALALVWDSMNSKKKMKLIVGTPELLLILTMAVSIWAVDASANLEGIITAVVIVLAKNLIINAAEKDKMQSIEYIGYLGAGITLVGLLSLFIPDLSEKFWMAERLGGIFQYSNTCALFLFLGIVIEDSKEPENKILHHGVMVLNLLGLLATGSRSILLLLIIWGIYEFVVNKSKRATLAVAGAGSLAVAVGYVFITGSNQNLGRIFTLLSSNSTVWGRLLYDIDGIKMLMRHPFGLGYMGYYYIQGAEQTGVYTTRFVHNDFLQMGLDYGIPAMLIFIAVIVWQLVKGKQSVLYKKIILIISVASLMDFHLQYISIVMILLLTFDFEADLFGREIDLTKRKAIVSVGALAVMIAGIYLSIGYTALYKADYTLAGKVLKKNTQVMTELMISTSDANEVQQLADEIISVNDYSVDAWNYLGYFAAMEGDYDRVVECQDKAVSLAKYDTDRYRAYELLLEDCIEKGADEAKYQAVIDKLPERLAALEETTSPIAYKLRDLPDFEY